MQEEKGTQSPGVSLRSLKKIYVTTGTAKTLRKQDGMGDKLAIITLHFKYAVLLY